MQIERIRTRVSEGGHNVEDAKVIARRQRSFDQLALFAKHLDRLMIFNNSTGAPRLAAYKRFKKPIEVIGSVPRDLRVALQQGEVPIARGSH